MKPEELYKSLERLIELEKAAERRKLEMGCPEARQYRDIINSLPQILSISDLINYHKYVLQKTSSDEGGGLKGGILRKLREVSTPESFEDLRRIVESA